MVKHKSYNKTLNHYGLQVILDEAISIWYQFPGCQNPWCDNSQGTPSWLGYCWCFGNAWRDLYCKLIGREIDISASFKLKDVLTPQELQNIAVICGITAPYNNE